MCVCIGHPIRYFIYNVHYLNSILTGPEKLYK